LVFFSENSNELPMTRRRIGAAAKRRAAGRTKAIMHAYSNICLTLSPLHQEDRKRVIKAVAIILGVVP
jgi:hypothetical protein